MILHRGKWLQLNRINDPTFGEQEYFHEHRCNGQIVSLLPYRYNDYGMVEYLLRHEMVIAWGSKKWGSITGGVENKNITESAICELQEESGYKIIESELIVLGQCFGAKSVDTVYYLFSCDLTGKTREKPKGDGSAIETDAEVFWWCDISKSVDPLTFISYWRLNEKSTINSTG